MKISEIFYSIQGESSYSGLPCVFVRTSGCNLKCSYCDTQYADQVNFTLTPQEVLSAVNSFNHLTLVEITGGEPLLQEDIYELIEIFHHHNFDILLETNGSLPLNNIPSYVAKIVDIKAPGSGFPNSFLLENLERIDPQKDNLKIVLSSLEDYNWMKVFLAKYSLFGHHILISTVFNKIDPKMIVENILKDRLNIRFQIQLHKYIWEANERGR